MKEAGEKGLVWSEETIDKYLENPREFVPKNKMAFVGLQKPEDSGGRHRLSEDIQRRRNKRPCDAQGGAPEAALAGLRNSRMTGP